MAESRSHVSADVVKKVIVFKSCQKGWWASGQMSGVNACSTKGFYNLSHKTFQDMLLSYITILTKFHSFIHSPPAFSSKVFSTSEKTVSETQPLLFAYCFPQRPALYSDPAAKFGRWRARREQSQPHPCQYH